jgi:hypothetical protein
MSLKRFAADQGWTDDTLLTLLEEFIDEQNLTAAAMQCLHGVAEVEAEMSELDEDEDWTMEGEPESDG